MLTLLLAVAAADSPKVVYYDEMPTTLNPLYAQTEADLRAQELIFDRLYFNGVVS